MTYRKKLIEVALPLDAINKESAREKSIRHGHPSTLHLWWSRKPLATCRAVLFASLVDDPSNDLPEEEAKVERDRLFGILEELVKWENSNDENVLGRARAEIMRSTGGNPPPVLDPFCGGGSIPLEAQRLGLEAHGSDLNPVAVLITKALIEIPPRFAGQPPVNPEAKKGIGYAEGWRGARGLAEDVRYYGKWMRDEAEKRIGHLYPKGPNGETVIAWLWARTVRCPNPACGATMPLATKFWLSKKAGNKAWVEPVVDREAKEVRFAVKTGNPDTAVSKLIDAGTGFINDKGKKTKATFGCVVCKVGVVRGDYANDEANNGRMGTMPLAVVAKANRGRTYLPFDEEQERTALQDSRRYLEYSSLLEESPTEPARGTFASNAQGRVYGFKTFADYFTLRQLIALTTFSELVGEARERVLRDSADANLLNDGQTLDGSGSDAQAYADAVATYLGMAVSRLSDICNSLCVWESTKTQVRHLFLAQAIPMLWDFAEPNVFASSAGDFEVSLENMLKALEKTPARGDGAANQIDASSSLDGGTGLVISTDPPYYDNVSYADLSDFFYVWLRRSLGTIYPDMFSTLLVPKAQELVATPYRFGGSKQKARQFFEEGFDQAFDQMRDKASSDYPITVYYAFKQSESESTDGVVAVASTGWETMLEGLLANGFQITGTWPMRSELGNRVFMSGTNALASSIVLACRPRPQHALPATRQEFVRALRRELPDALSVMMAENVAPVDLAQATIGPGMAIFSRYSKVVEADGPPMRVRTALQIINQSLDEYLSEAEGAVDPHTRFALTWFEQRGMQDGPYGEAESVATARNVSVRGVQDAGILEARAGKVRLLPREKLAEDWDPATDGRLTDWEVVQHLIRALETEGEMGAAYLLARVGERGEGARDLAYRLYGICERKKWAEEALAYNGLVVSWPEISRLAAENPSGTEAQGSFEL